MLYVIGGKTMRILTALCFTLIVSGCAIAEEKLSVPIYPDHSHLMYYLDSEGREYPVKTVADWAHRRRDILAGMQRAMGELPKRTGLPPLDVRITESLDRENYTRLTISFVAEKNDRVPAYLYVPNQTEKKRRLPAILALHPTGPLGKGIVDGQSKRLNRAYARELAERGYIVIAPDYPSFGDYKDYNFETDHYVSGTMKGIFNHMRCVDLLQGRPDVDRQRIGAIGHSLGGHNAMFVGVFDTRIKVIVSSSGWDPFHYYYGGKLKGWTSNRYMPRLSDVYQLDPDRVPFDFYEVVAALAPRAFFSNSPLHDDNFDVRGVKKAIPLAAEVYRLFDATDHLQVRYPDSGHDFPTKVREEAYRFIDKNLHHKPHNTLLDK